MRQDPTVPGNCWSARLLRQHDIVPGEYENPWQFTVRKTVHPWQLLALRSSTVRQDCQSPAITRKKNIYCPARAQKLQQLDLLVDSRLLHDKIPGIALLRKTVWVPGTILVIWRAVLKWSSTQAAIFKLFLKILYENTIKNKNKLDAEIIKTSKLYNEIICRPPKTRENIPLNYFLWYFTFVLHHQWIFIEIFAIDFFYQCAVNLVYCRVHQIFLCRAECPCFYIKIFLIEECWCIQLNKRVFWYA